MPPDPTLAPFWQWFEQNGSRLRADVYGPDDDARQRASDELRDAVEPVAPGVVLEIGRGPGDGPGLLVVSADGRAERVDAVKDFAASAPALAGWEVVAFRPRTPIGDSIEIVIQGERISPADIWFDVAESGDGLGLTLYVRGLTPDNQEVRGLGASLLAEHAVGERDAVTLVTSLDARPLPPSTDGLRPFHELVGVIDAARDERFPPPGELPLDPEGDWQGMQGTISGAPAVVLLHTQLSAVAGHPAYDQRLTVRLPFHEVRDDGMPATEAEYEAVCAVGDRVGEALAADQQSLFALSIMSDGRRELVFYTSDADAALRRIDMIRQAGTTHDIDTDVERDTFWGMYRAFLGAGDGDGTEDADEGE